MHQRRWRDPRRWLVLILVSLVGLLVTRLGPPDLDDAPPPGLIPNPALTATLGPPPRFPSPPGTVAASSPAARLASSPTGTATPAPRLTPTPAIPHVPGWPVLEVQSTSRFYAQVRQVVAYPDHGRLVVWAVFTVSTRGTPNEDSQYQAAHLYTLQAACVGPTQAYLLDQAGEVIELIYSRQHQTLTLWTLVGGTWTCAGGGR